MNRRGPWHIGAAIALACVAQSSCMRVAQERAERDEQVGHAAEGGVSADVRDGHAAVRSLAPGALRLWANAPTVAFTLRTGPAPLDWTIRVENALPEATLAVTSTDPGAGQPVEGAPLAPTDRQWRVSLPPDTTVELVLGAPDRDTREPWSFAVYGDVQDAIDRVQDIYRRMNEESAVRFVVIVGDLTEQGTPSELERFQRELKPLTRPVYATLGNHELGDTDVPYHAYFGRGSSHFAFRGVHFSLLDSASATVDPIVFDWLDGWLAEGARDLHVVGMHIPPLDAEGVRNGSFASRAEANRLLTRLARGGVDLSVYGHVHSYYAYANAGIPAFITGGGGAIPERMDGIGRHFLVFDADPISARITGRLVRVD